MTTKERRRRAPVLVSGGDGEPQERPVVFHCFACGAAIPVAIHVPRSSIEEVQAYLSESMLPVNPSAEALRGREHLDAYMKLLSAGEGETVTIRGLRSGGDTNADTEGNGNAQ